MKDVDKVVRVESSVWGGTCEECGSVFTQAGSPTRDSDFEPKVNHYLGHGYVILHVGQESDRDAEGDPYQYTVAVLGKPR